MHAYRRRRLGDGLEREFSEPSSSLAWRVLGGLWFSKVQMQTKKDHEFEKSHIATGNPLPSFFWARLGLPSRGLPFALSILSWPASDIFLIFMYVCQPLAFPRVLRLPPKSFRRTHSKVHLYQKSINLCIPLGGPVTR